MKFFVCARTVDNWFEDSSGQRKTLPVVEVDLTKELSSYREAELWLEKVLRDHPELIEHKRLIQDREIELVIKGVER